MKIAIDLSEEELQELEVIGINVKDATDPVLKMACKTIFALMKLRHEVAVSGAMRWTNSQEFPLKICCEISDT